MFTGDIEVTPLHNVVLDIFSPQLQTHKELKKKDLTFLDGQFYSKQQKLQGR